MKNFVQKGNVVTLAAPYDRLSGQGALVGSTFGVAVNDVLNGADGEWRTTGVVTLPKAATALTQGGPVYWDDSAKKVTSTSSANTKIGVSLSTQASGDTADATVRLNGSF